MTRWWRIAAGRPQGENPAPLFGHERDPSAPSCLQRLVEPRIDPPGIAFVDLVAILGAEIGGRLDVALGVVVIVAGLRIDPPYRADHFAGEQDVVDRDHPGQEIDARL